jgi:4-hydroxy-tetrahydrodipicolinate synthase
MSEKSNRGKLGGVIPAIITPFDEKGRVEFGYLEKQVGYLCNAGVHGLFVNGTTGEGGHLTTEEKVEVYQKVKDTAGREIVLCAACIQPSTDMVLEEIRIFETLEPDYIVAVTPYYYDASQEVIFRHFQTIAQASPAPVIIYNIPSRTHNPIHLDTIRRLAEEENIGGIKDSTGNFVLFSEGLLGEFPESFPWIQGEDLLDGPSLLLGAKGMVTGLSNIWVDPYTSMFQASREGKVDAVVDCQRKVNRLWQVIGVSGGKTNVAIKAAVSLLGRCSKWMRTSTVALTDEEMDRVKQVLQDLRLL